MKHAEIVAWQARAAIFLDETGKGERHSRKRRAGAVGGWGSQGDIAAKGKLWPSRGWVILFSSLGFTAFNPAYMTVKHTGGAAICGTRR